MDFEEWLTREGLSGPSIQKFLDALKGPLAMFFDLQYLGAGSLCDITDLDLFNKITERIESDSEFQIRNKRGANIYSATLEKYREFLTAAGKSVNREELGPHRHNLQDLGMRHSAESYMPFDQSDGTLKILSDIVKRRGENQFRQNLLRIYVGKCAITGSNFFEILEVAYITPFLGSDTNRPCNGLILRSDIHTLWDLGLVAIDPQKLTIWIHPSITDAAYRSLDGAAPFIPKLDTDRPSGEALARHWATAHVN